MIKDLFSTQSAQYAAFRPTYPPALYEYLMDRVPLKERAWDCATGNGQVAYQLVHYFQQVEATDISQSQLNHAQLSPNIRYHLAPAHQGPFPDSHFDLITVAQALHWFATPEFFQEVKRVGRNGGLLAVWGYNQPVITPEVDQILYYFYTQVVGPYWDADRRHVDKHYQSIDFPFDKMETAEFAMPFHWNLAQLEGYISTWSSVLRYIKEKEENPLPALKEKLSNCWKEDENKKVVFPLFMRLCWIEK
jgi:ubiquinone/menaquinone biosynthesis C-methylase UbiE